MCGARRCAGDDGSRPRSARVRKAGEHGGVGDRAARCGDECGDFDERCDEQTPGIDLGIQREPVARGTFRLVIRARRHEKTCETSRDERDVVGISAAFDQFERFAAERDDVLAIAAVVFDVCEHPCRVALPVHVFAAARFIDEAAVELRRFRKVVIEIR